MGSEYVRRFERSSPASHRKSHLESLYDEADRAASPVLPGQEPDYRSPRAFSISCHFTLLKKRRRAPLRLFSRFPMLPARQSSSPARKKPASRANTSSLILGIPDEGAPRKSWEEAQSVSALLPQAYASRRERRRPPPYFEKKGPAYRLCSIFATPRRLPARTTPMFFRNYVSGDGYLNLFDLYQMRY